MEGRCWICNKKKVITIGAFEFCKKCIEQRRDFWIPCFGIDDTLMSYFRDKYDYIFSLHSKILSRMVFCSKSHLFKSYFEGCRLSFMPPSLIKVQKGRLKMFLSFEPQDYVRVKKSVD